MAFQRGPCRLSIVETANFVCACVLRRCAWAQVTISKDDTIILDGGGEKSAINERCDQLRESVSATTSDYDRRVPRTSPLLLSYATAQ